MKKQIPDFARIYDHHKWIHGVLLNWARWVTPRTSPQVSPMFRDYRSHAWQWHPREYRESCDLIQAHQVERLVSRMPPTHREAIRWAYVYRCTPEKACKVLQLRYDGLARHVHDARSMLDLAMTGSDSWVEAVIGSGMEAA